MRQTHCLSTRLSLKRNFSASSSPINRGKIFNRHAKTIQRERGARSPESVSCDYIREEVASRLADRISDIQNYKYPLTVDYMCHAGQLSRRLLNHPAGIEHIIACDTSKQVITRDDHNANIASAWSSSLVEDARDRETPVAIPQFSSETNVNEKGASNSTKQTTVSRYIVSPDAFPFPSQSIDLVLSNLALHWTDDLGNLVSSIHRALKPNGAFIGALFGGNTLKELKEAFMVAEQEREGGISQHISPMAGVSDVGNVLTASGFALTTVDTEEFKIQYADPFVLMHELRVMGEGNAIVHRRSHTPRETIFAAAAAYKALHGLPDGTIPATFQVIYFIGWVPHISQPKAKPRGSATVSLKDLASLMGKQVSQFESLPDDEEEDEKKK